MANQLVLGIGILAILIAAVAGVQGKKDVAKWGLAFGFLILAVGFFVGGTPLAGGLAAGVLGPTGPQQIPQVQVVSNTCPTGLATTGLSAALNTVNTSVDYKPSSVVYVGPDGKTVVATGTATGGASISYLSTTIPCTTEIYTGGVTLYALPTATDLGFSSGKTDVLKFANGAT